MSIAQIAACHIRNARRRINDIIGNLDGCSDEQIAARAIAWGGLAAAYGIEIRALLD